MAADAEPFSFDSQNSNTKSDTTAFCSFVLYRYKNLTQFSVLPYIGALKEESSFLLGFPTP